VLIVAERTTAEIQPSCRYSKNYPRNVLKRQGITDCPGNPCESRVCSNTVKYNKAGLKMADGIYIS
jgi:hypothetical protein